MFIRRGYWDGVPLSKVGTVVGVEADFHMQVTGRTSSHGWVWLTIIRIRNRLVTWRQQPTAPRCMMRGGLKLVRTCDFLPS